MPVLELFLIHCHMCGSHWGCLAAYKKPFFYCKSRENLYQYYKSHQNPYQVLQVSVGIKTLLWTCSGGSDKGCMLALVNPPTNINNITNCYTITISHEQPIPSLPSPVTIWTNQVLDIGIQDQLRAHLSTMKPRPSIYCPDFIAANQEDRADNVLSGKGVVTPLKYTMSSLAPWPSCRSVWSLAVIQKLGRGKAWSILSRVNDVSVYLGRQMGGGGRSLTERTSFSPFLVASVRVPKFWMFTKCKTYHSSFRIRRPGSTHSQAIHMIVQFLIAYSIQKQRFSDLPCKWCQCWPTLDKEEKRLARVMLLLLNGQSHDNHMTNTP